jgi:hypothetical protein
MGMRHRIIGILMKPEVQKIRFNCGSRTVNNLTFNGVVSMLKKKKIHIEADEDDLDENAAAEYVDDEHTYIFKSRSFGIHQKEQGVIVHESVHAGFDVIGHGGRYKRVDDEASAYLAESFFLLNSGFTFDEVPHVLPLRLAFTIALNMQSKKQFTVSKDDLVLLRNGVARDQITKFGTDTRKGPDTYKGIP